MSASGQSARELPAGEFSRSGSAGVWSVGLGQRIALLILLFGAEWMPIMKESRIGIGGQSVFRMGIVCTTLFLALGYIKAGETFRRISGALEKTPIGWGYLAGHICALLAVLYLSRVPLGGTPASAPAYMIALGCYSAAILAVGFAIFALVPPKLTWQLIRSTGSAWAYALPVGWLAWWLMNNGEQQLRRRAEHGQLYLWDGPFWQPAMDLTFGLVKALLHLFLPRVVADNTTMTIGSPNFAVTLLSGCSGWEGTALILVFSVSWLLVLRREFRFPRAFLLVPAAMVTMWVSNAVRITVLILIGVAGAPNVAMQGFHSEAGWIAFNCVALGCAVASRKISWFAVGTPRQTSHEPLAASPAAAHLMPFLAILAAGMISRAAAGGVEWLYPLRLLAAAGALWFFRSKYTQMDWRCGWLSFVLGSGAFAIWLAVDLFSGAPTDPRVASELASWPDSPRIAWLVCRVAAAVITVPLAEELAFRGFLIRYLISRDFDLLHPRRFTVFSVWISSLIFGLLHGSHWLAGAVAGLLYAVAFLRRGRIGDAAMAHAATNAWLAGWVLWSGNWSLW